MMIAIFLFVKLMSKMAPIVGQDIIERYFLPHFKALCSDPLFHVRTVRAGFRISVFSQVCLLSVVFGLN